MENATKAANGCIFKYGAYILTKDNTSGNDEETEFHFEVVS